MSFELFGGDEVGEMVDGAIVRVSLWWRAFKGLVSLVLRFW